MAPSNKIWTLKDTTNGSPNTAHDIPSHSAKSKNSYNGKADTEPNGKNGSYNPLSAAYCKPVQPGTVGDCLSKLCHIPNLPYSDVCEATLKRIQQEFEPIVRQRGYNVLSVSEMCCCGDGLDHDILPGGRKRVKRRKQNSNVLGYNQTSSFGSGKKRSHTIHLRLRDPHDHERLLPWEDVAGTMAHELSHCVHQNHKPPFYKLMEEILEQHATLQVNSIGWQPNALNAASIQDRRKNNENSESSVPAETHSFPTEGGQRLGGKNLNGRQISGEAIPGPGSVGGWGAGNPLGGSGGGDGGGGRSRLSARDAAARAAESRRRQLDRVRKMVETSKASCVIEILDDEDEEEVGTHAKDRPSNSKTLAAAAPGKDGTIFTKSRPSNEKNSVRPMDRKRPPGETKPLQTRTSKVPFAAEKAKPVAKAAVGAAAAVIDLTIDEVDSPCARPRSMQEISSPQSSLSEWSCGTCTFRNQPIALACSMCQTERR